MKSAAGYPHAVFVFCAMFACPGALAQDDSAPESQKQHVAAGEPKTLATIVVTGTHIRGVDLETEHPLQVLTRADIVRTGLTGVADVLQSLIIANGQTLNRNINNGGNGELRVNLRSLGANRTLVLVNGRRWASAVDGAVDLSAIPLPLVQRIEVLKDGASAVYGSDAIGGVINIITRRDYSGAELGMYAGQADHGDGTSRHADFSFGRGGNRWSAAFGLEWGDDDPIMASDRSISSVPAPGLPLGNTGSPATQYGVFRVRGVFDQSPIVLITGRPGTSPDDFRKQDVRIDRDYDPVPYNYLRTPQQRRAGFGQFRFDLTPNLTLTADGLFNRRQSAQQLAPPVVTFSPIQFAGTSQAFGMSVQSVYNQFDAPVVGTSTRWADSLPRRFEQTVDTQRMHLGLEGAFTAFAHDWIWNADVTRTRTAEDETGGPYVDNEKLALALGPSFRDAQGVARCGTPDNVVDGCVPFDLFGGPGRYTPAVLDYLDVVVHNRSHTRTDSLDFGASGTLADLAAGPLGFAAGAERRLERGSDIPDPLVAAGHANGTGLTYGPTAGAYSVNEAYLELDVSLLADKPLARRLDVNLATRYSDYSQFGGTDNSRIGLRWKPVDDLLVRSTLAQGFRAPSISEAFGGSITTSGNVFDPCAIDAGAGYTLPPPVAAHCRTQGVPVEVAPNFFSVIVFGSNRELRPELARSLTAGLVYSPPWLPDFDASVDWYRIRIRDAIGNPGPQYYMDQCYTFGDAGACAHVTRAPDGNIIRIVATLENLPGGIEAEGWDFGLGWKRSTRAGTFRLRWENAHVSYWGAIGQPPRGTVLGDGSLASGNVAGHGDPVYGVIWRLRSVAALVWQRNRWNTSIGARYFSPIVESCDVVKASAREMGDPSLLAMCSQPDHEEDGVRLPRNRVGAVTYIDLEASWDAPWRARVSAGVRNAFDRDPPHAWSYSGVNSYFPDYDTPGRFWWLSYRQKF